MSSFQTHTPTKSTKPSPFKGKASPSPNKKNTASPSKIQGSPVKRPIPLSEDEARRALYLQLLLLQDTLRDSMQIQETNMQQDLLKAWQVVYDIENQAAAMENEAMRVSKIAQLDKTLHSMVNQ